MFTEEQKDEIKRVIRQELGTFIRSDRFTFEKLLQLLDGRHLQLGNTTGTKIGTAATQKLGLWNATPIVQPSGTGETAGFSAGAGTNVTDQSTFTGNVGSTAYRISDVVKALKNSGIMKQ